MATSLGSNRPALTRVDRDAAAVHALVRKTAHEEALVTDWDEVSDSVQRVNVRWSPEHPFYIEGGQFRALLFTESLRQALALLTHDVHQVPLGHRLGWEHISLAVNAGALSTTDGGNDVTLLVNHPSVNRRRLGSVRVVSHITALRRGQRLGTAEVHYTAHPPAVYDRLRGRYADAHTSFARALPATPPVPAPTVGRTHERDVVLSPERPSLWRLRIDVGHRVLFDHPHDHVPGMVLLEAAAQAAQAMMDHPVLAVGFETRFLRYVEFDSPCMVSAELLPADADGRARIAVSASQEERPVFSCTVTVLPRVSCDNRPPVTSVEALPQ